MIIFIRIMNRQPLAQVLLQLAVMLIFLAQSSGLVSWSFVRRACLRSEQHAQHSSSSTILAHHFPSSTSSASKLVKLTPVPANHEMSSMMATGSLGEGTITVSSVKLRAHILQMASTLI